MPADGREATMNDRSAMLVQAGLKQRKTDVVAALATDRSSSLHAVRWIIDSTDWYEILIQQHGPPRSLPFPALGSMASACPALSTLPRSWLHGRPPAPRKNG